MIITFVSGFVNQNIIAGPNIILNLEVLQEYIAQQLSIEPAALQRFLVSFYEDEVHERAVRNLNLQVLNASHSHHICRALSGSKPFEHDTTVGIRMSALIVPVRTERHKR